MTAEEFANRSLYEAVAHHKRLTPDAPALYYQTITVSYRRLLSESDAVAAALSRLGVTEGKAVTVCLPNIPQAVAVFYGLSRLGAVAHMVHPLAPEAQLLSFMEKAGSDTVFMLDIGAYRYPDVLNSKRVILCSPASPLGKLKHRLFSLKNRAVLKPLADYPSILDYETWVRDALSAPPAPTPTRDPHETAVYLHSGGTGGAHKTVELSAYAINALCGEGETILSIPGAAGLSMLSVLPMFHGFGLAMGVHAMLSNGGANAIMPKFRTKEVVKFLKAGKFNYVIGVPAMYEALLKCPAFKGKPLHHLRQCFVGGDFVSQSLLDRFNEHLGNNGSKGKLYEGYGLTETVTVCAVNTNAGHKTGSIGRPLAPMHIAAFSDDLTPLTAPQEGELCVSGPLLMNGYLGDPAATNAALFEFEGRKYVKTGDIGHVDGDGYVYFKSRQKRLVKVSGIPVFPSEVEHLSADYCRDIRDIAAVDVPDERTGSKLVLFITLAAPPSDTDTFIKDLTAHIESKLSVYARPKSVYILPALPQTLVGKVDVLKLKERCQNGEFK